MIFNCKLKQQTNASARIVDGTLVLSLPDAIAPVVWQMDLGQAKSSALEVQHDEGSSTFALSLKTPRGEAVEVAKFTDRAHALEGLMAASSALENAHGQIRSGVSVGDTTASTSRCTRTGARGKWLKALLAFFVLFAFFFLWSLSQTNSVSTSGSLRTSSSAKATSARNASGVPVSADDFLNQ